MSTRLAESIVADAAITPRDHVVEPGAGAGVLTAALAAHAHHVTTLELDARLAAEVTHRFHEVENVTVVHADATTVALSLTPFRVVGNPAFNTTAALLHHLLDLPARDTPRNGLTRADLVVQWQVARHRAAVTSDLQGATWAPWWRFRRGRRIPAALFRPAPRVDAAILEIERRDEPWLPVEEFGAYARFVRDEFGQGNDGTEIDGARWAARYQARRR